MYRETDLVLIWFAILFLIVGIIIGELWSEIVSLENQLARKPRVIYVGPKEKDLVDEPA